MPRVVNVGGVRRTFPDDATDDEIRAALSESSGGATHSDGTPKDFHPVNATELMTGALKGVGSTVLGGLDVLTDIMPGQTETTKSLTDVMTGGKGQIGTKDRRRQNIEALRKRFLDTGGNLGEETGMAVEQLAEFFLPSGAAKIASIPGMAKAPWLLKMLGGAALEGGKSAGLEAAHGGDVGDVIEGGLIGGAGGGLMNTPVRKIMNSAGRSLARAVGATSNEVPDVVKVADQALEEGIGVGTRRQLGGRIDAKEAAAAQRQIAAADQLGDVEVGPIRQRLEKVGQSQGPNIPSPSLTRIEVEQISAGLQQMQGMPKSVQQAVFQAFKTTPQEFEQARAAYKLGPGTGYNQFRETVREQSGDLVDLSKALGGGGDSIPGRELVKHRQIIRDPSFETRVAGNRLPPSKEGLENVRREISEAVHDPLLKGGSEMAAADKQFHTWKTLKTSIDGALGKDVSRTNQNHLLKYILGRSLMGTLVGSGVTAKTGSWQAGALSGATVAALGNTAIWNSLSAATKFKVAKAVNSGNFELAVKLFEAGASGAASGLPQAPED